MGKRDERTNLALSSGFGTFASHIELMYTFLIDRIMNESRRKVSEENAKAS